MTSVTRGPSFVMENGSLGPSRRTEGSWEPGIRTTVWAELESGEEEKGERALWSASVSWAALAGQHQGRITQVFVSP